VESSFPRDINALADIFDFISDFLGRHEPSQEVKYFVEFAVEEVFTNIVKYSSSDASDVSIRLRLQSEKCIEIRLIDRNSVHFDITQTEDVDTTLPLEGRKVGGLGLHLIRRMADGVEYEHVDGDSIITITKNLED